MTSIEKLRENNEKAERTLQAENAEYDSEREKLKKRYQGKLAKLADKARDTQKALADAEAAQALAERKDLTDAEKQALANGLGLELP